MGNAQLVSSLMLSHTTTIRTPTLVPTHRQTVELFANVIVSWSTSCLTLRQLTATTTPTIAKSVVTLILTAATGTPSCTPTTTSTLIAVALTVSRRLVHVKQ